MNELAIVAAWCLGVAEVPLADGTRVDCLTETHAFEVDRGENWHEAVGQALHYSRLTGKLPGVVLIDPSEAQLERVERLVWHWRLPVKVEVIHASD